MPTVTVPYKMEKIGTDTTVFMFDKLFDYAEFINQVSPIATGKAKKLIDSFNYNKVISNIKSGGKSIYGSDNADEVVNEFTTYLFNNELSDFLESTRNTTVNVNAVDIDQKKKIEFTERELGIFSFDIASLGLIRVVYYFSQAMNSIVDANMVRSKKDAGGKNIFYFTGQTHVERHLLKMEAKWLYSAILKKIIPESDAEKVEDDNSIIHYYYPEKQAIPEHEVEQRQQLDGQGRPKFATTWKKCFVHIPKPLKQLPRVDIILNSSYSWSVRGDTEMLWSSLAGIALAEKLEQSGVDFRLFVSYPVRLDSDRKVYSFVKIKDSGTPINKNAIAIAVSDPRQFRYIGFKGFVAASYMAGYNNFISDGIGGAINDKDAIKGAFIDFLKTQNDYDTSQDAILRNSKIVFTQSLSQQEAMDSFNDTVTEISQI
jgi:hypothetical protein